MLDAVRGGTSGALRLTQRTVAGAGSGGGLGGAARSELTSVKEGAGALAQVVEAQGGAGSVGGSAHAAASGRTEGAGAVSVRATAVGGSGTPIPFGASDPAGSGGVASLGVVSGVSTGGGDVEVTGEVTGGAGGNRSSGSGDGGDGASALLENSVDGETTGSLTLVQRARGGAGGSTSGTDVGSAPGRGGSAKSRLTKDTDARALTVVAEALGALAGSGPGTTGVTGSSADASAEAVNGSGSALAVGRAVAGAGARGGAGGSATLFASSTTRGDGDAVQVGRVYAADPRLSETGAFGGAAIFAGATGGDAQSRSIGVALGDSEVRVYDLAVGGGTGLRGTPGRAVSEAQGRSAGDAAVAVHALALAGAGGSTTRETTAHASGEGLGSVLADAIADASRTSSAARAQAGAVGSDGSATAEARSAGGRFTQTRAIATAALVASAAVEARADSFGAPPAAGLDGSVDAFAFVTATGERPEVFGRAALGLLDRQGLDADHHDIRLRSDEDDDDEIPLRAEAVFAQPSLNLGSSGSLVVSFLSVEVGSEEFEELRFLIRNGETTLLDEDFDETDDALEFFQGPLGLELGPGVVPLDLHFVLELESERAGAGFSTLFALGTIPVPEPSTGSLLLAGLVLLARRRATSSSEVRPARGRAPCARSSDAPHPPAGPARPTARLRDAG
jgi:hypothetical protein